MHHKPNCPALDPFAPQCNCGERGPESPGSNLYRSEEEIGIFRVAPWPKGWWAVYAVDQVPDLYPSHAEAMAAVWQFYAKIEKHKRHQAKPFGHRVLDKLGFRE